MTVLGNQITERGMTVFQDQSTHSLFQTLLSLNLSSMLNHTVF